MSGPAALESLRLDLRYALRTMLRAPGFTASAVVSLALGIGANTAIFSLVDAMMLRTLPVREPGELVELLTRFPGEPAFNAFSWRRYRYFVDHNHVLSAVIGAARAPSPRGSSFQVRQEGQAWQEGAEAASVDGVYVTGNYFSALGVEPAAGRLIAPEDDRPEAPAAVAVVSWTYWKSRFNLDRGVLGRRILVNGLPVTIVGVAGRGFAGWRIESHEDLWLPLAVEPLIQPENNYYQSAGGNFTLVGRLLPRTTMAQALAEMGVLYRRTLEEDPRGGGRFLSVMRFELEPAGAGLSSVRAQYGKPLLMLMGVVGLLLLIACTNVASLLLARAAARQREMAVRVSLGATRWRLTRQMLTESLLLAAAGTAAGTLLAYCGATALLRIMASGREPVDLHVEPDGRVLLFTAGAAILTGLLFGLAPALRAWAAAPASSLREAARGGETPVRRLFGKSLVVLQVAFSMVLLTAAVLFVQHLAGLYAGLGFQRDRLLLIALDPSHSGIRRDQLGVPYRQLMERLEAIPGVRSATLSGMTPISGMGANRDATVESYQPKPGELRYLTENWIAPKFFETYGTPLLAGRDFSFADEGRPRVAIVNRAMARYYFGGASPIGKHVRFDGDDKPYEIVGLVADAKYRDVDEAAPRIIYLNAFQEGRLFSQFSLRTTIPPGAVAGEARRVTGELLKNIPITRVTTLADQVDASIVPERLLVALSGLFGALGLVLAAVGLYGLLAYTVARRVGEIGIRMALGATRAHIARLVLADALGMVFAGLVCGLPMVLWGHRIAATLIPSLRATTWEPVFLTTAVMIAIALLAAGVPARRAAAVDPMDALRHE